MNPNIKLKLNLNEDDKKDCHSDIRQNEKTNCQLSINYVGFFV